MADREWRFHTIPVCTSETISYRWTWSVAGEEMRAGNTFSGLHECVADATSNGFTGRVNPTHGFRVGDRQDAGIIVSECGAPG